MDGFGDQFGTVRTVAVDLYTAAYRISGSLPTRFVRVADIVNQVSTTHLAVERATVSEYADPTATLSAGQVLVSLSEILVVVVNETTGETAHAEMRIPKRPVRAQVALPPFRLTGFIHVPHGSRPSDGLLNAVDRFLPMTDTTLASSAYPELGRHVAALALQRDLAHLILVSDDERPDELLAEVLDEQTAESWLRPEQESAR